MLSHDIGNGTRKYFCEILEIDRYLFYSYITEINLFFAELGLICGEYSYYEIIYDRFQKRYILIKN